jgi:hypothetical protein
MSLKEINVVWIRKSSAAVAEAQSFAPNESEARKEVLYLAREHVKQILNDRNTEQLPDLSTVVPLWKGAEVTESGPVMICTNPGPNTSSIDIFESTQYVPYLYGETSYYLSDDHACVYFTTLQKAGTGRKAEQTDKDIDAKFEVDGKQVFRREDTPHNRVLNDIDSRLEEEAEETEPEEEEEVEEEEIKEGAEDVEIEVEAVEESEPVVEESNEEAFQPVAFKKRRKRRRQEGATPVPESLQN